jgi:hypothetical protein
MINTKITFILLFFALVSGYAATSMSIYKASGSEKICTSAHLGKVVVLPESAWRSDQKEPEKREEMALEEIKKAFSSFPCGDISKEHDIREFSNWSDRPEPELLNLFSGDGVDTIILIRIEELTPRINITFSLPFLWGGSNEADFRIRVLSTKTGAVLNDMRIKRITGGPFNIRPAEWSRFELNSALKEVIDK